MYTYAGGDYSLQAGKLLFTLLCNAYNLNVQNLVTETTIHKVHTSAVLIFCESMSVQSVGRSSGQVERSPFCAIAVIIIPMVARIRREGSPIAFSDVCLTYCFKSSG